MSVVFCGLCPHPPIMVPQVGRGRDQKVAETQQAMLELGRRIHASKARTLVMITPHGPVFSDAIGISVFPRFYGDLGQFGAPDVKFHVENDLELVLLIKEYADARGVPVVGVDENLATRHRLGQNLDHGITAPFYFFQEAGVNLPLVHVSMGMLDYKELYSFGLAVQEAAVRLGRPTAVVASGDLSHRLTKDAPLGFHPASRSFDLKVKKLLEQVYVPGFLTFDPKMTEEAGQCGLLPIIMMLGALDGREVRSETLSYQGPFGVGYLVVALEPGGIDESRRYDRRLARTGSLKDSRSYPVQVAKEALDWYYDRNRKKKFRAPQMPADFPSQPAGVFVTLKTDGELRGCIGTTVPTHGGLVKEIAVNAINAATRDTRFHPVREEELRRLEIVVDILTLPERVDDLALLDPKKYGVIVSSQGKRSLLLPNIEGVETVEQQLSIVRQKVGIEPGEPIRLERFEVTRYE